jgi:hypothetical protein
MLHPDSLRGDLALKLPPLRLVIRDKAHATRRLTERTFACDNCLRRIMQAVVLGQGSASRLLKNSRSLQCIFEGRSKNKSVWWIAFRAQCETCPSRSSGSIPLPSHWAVACSTSMR